MSEFTYDLIPRFSSLLVFCLSVAQNCLSWNKLVTRSCLNSAAGTDATPSCFLSFRVTLYVYKKSRGLKSVGCRACFHLSSSVSVLQVHALKLCWLEYFISLDCSAASQNYFSCFTVEYKEGFWQRRPRPRSSPCGGL